MFGKSKGKENNDNGSYRAEYERNNARVKSPLGRKLKYKRQSRVEPVFGTLTQFPGLRKINTKGIKQANKVMHMAAIAYNLKKYLKFDQKLAQIKRKSLALKNSAIYSIMAFVKLSKKLYFI